MKWPRTLVSAVAALVLALAPVLPAAAQHGHARGVDDFTFESLAADYTLDKDSSGHATLRVVETIVALFPENQNRGIVRAVPITDGEVPLELTMLSITDENGSPWQYERNDYDGFAEFSLGTDEFLNGRTTFVLEYMLRDPIRHYSDSGGDEFYWDVNGNGWAQTFDTVSAHVELGPALAAALTGASACYLGYYGENDPCELTEHNGSFDVAVGPVAAYSTLTVSIGFEGGTVVQPPLPRDSWIVQIAPKVILILMVMLLVLSILLRTLGWRDAPGRGTVIAEYTPPKDSDLILDANVVARPTTGLPALFVDFAVRGIVRVVDNKPGEPTVSGRKRFALEFVTSDGATPRELGVLVTVFGASLTTGKRVRPGDLGADVGAALYTLPVTAAADAITKGLRARPVSRLPKVITRASGLAILALVVIAVWAIVNDVLDGNVLWPGVGSVVIAIAIPNVLIRPARLTRKGAELRDYLLGMKRYLTVAEEERLRMLQSPEGALRDRDAIVKLYERLLPYAVLWGVEDQWVDKLQAEYVNGTPDWLDGDTFNSSVFTSFTSSSTSAVRPIVSSSSSSSGGGGSWSGSGGSSSSSGSSGGGFSGGGGGGGGGGGR